jgi:hypothetical protein
MRLQAQRQWNVRQLPAVADDDQVLRAGSARLPGTMFCCDASSMVT